MKKFFLKAVVLSGLVLCYSPQLALTTHIPNSDDRLDIHGGDEVTHLDVINTLSSYAIPLTPLSEGVKEFKVTPAYLRVSNNFKRDDDKASGFGVAVSWFQGFSSHFGLSILGAYGRLSGDTVGIREYTDILEPGVFDAEDEVRGDTLVGTHRMDKNGYGIRGAVALIFDPFSNPKGFRLPLMIGFGAIYMEHEVKGTITSSARGGHLVSLDVNQKHLTPGFLLGISAQFNTGSFRWVPFFTIQTIIGEASTQSKGVKDVTTREDLKTIQNKSGDSFFPSMGISIQYRPWGLSFSYNPNFYYITSIISNESEEEPRVSIFSFTKTFSWGASKEE